MIFLAYRASLSCTGTRLAPIRRKGREKGREGERRGDLMPTRTLTPVYMSMHFHISPHKFGCLSLQPAWGSRKPVEVRAVISNLPFLLNSRPPSFPPYLLPSSLLFFYLRLPESDQICFLTHSLPPSLPPNRFSSGPGTSTPSVSRIATMVRQRGREGGRRETGICPFTHCHPSLPPFLPPSLLPYSAQSHARRHCSSATSASEAGPHSRPPS